MCASFLEVLRSGPPPPRVALLPDSLFFIRTLPVAAPAAEGMPEGGAAEAGGQIELALEGASPFPLAQLYYGYYSPPGSGRALAFAAYRRRFTADQLAAWERAEAVLPAFAALLGAEVPPATTLIRSAPEGLTAIHWGDGPVPLAVLFQPVDPEAADEERVAAREGLLRKLESRKIVDVVDAPVAEAGGSEGEIVFKCGEWVSRLPAAAISTLDVRDKGELAGLRRGRARDVLLWRVCVGCVAAYVLLALGDLALFGAGIWQKTRKLVYDAQSPAVALIINKQSVANQIENLSNKRMLPFEMISEVARKKPPNTYFLSAEAAGTDTLVLKAQTSNAAEIAVFQNEVQALPFVLEHGVEIRNPEIHGDTATYVMSVTFKPGALKPEPLPPAS